MSKAGQKQRITNQGSQVHSHTMSTRANLRLIYRKIPPQHETSSY